MRRFVITDIILLPAAALPYVFDGGVAIVASVVLVAIWAVLGDRRERGLRRG